MKRPLSIIVLAAALLVAATAVVGCDDGSNGRVDAADDASTVGDSDVADDPSPLPGDSIESPETAPDDGSASPDADPCRPAYPLDLEGKWFCPTLWTEPLDVTLTPFQGQCYVTAGQGAFDLPWQHLVWSGSPPPTQFTATNSRGPATCYRVVAE